MFKNAHIKKIDANGDELSEKISEIYNRNLIQIKNTLILENISDSQADKILELKTYFSNKNQTILVDINEVW
jgi:hypothetical protein